MPKFNLSSILSPKRNSNAAYSSATDLINIRFREQELAEGGDIQNSESYDSFINEYRAMSNDRTLSTSQRNDAKLQMLNLQKAQQAVSINQKGKFVSDNLFDFYEKDLRELSAAYPDNPYYFAEGAALQVDRILYGTGGLNEIITEYDSLGRDTSSLQETRSNFERESEKYNDIKEAFETNDNETLENYMVAYSVDDNRVKRMQIIDRRSEPISNTYNTNIKFSAKGDGAITISDTEEGQGMRMALMHADINDGEVIKFNGQDFTFSSFGKMFEMEEGQVFTPESIMYAPSGNIKPGSFARDSKGMVYYVNQDSSFSPLKSQKWRDELGYNEADVFDLTPSQEVNTLRGTITPFPEPLRERYHMNEPQMDFKPGFFETEAWRGIGGVKEIIERPFKTAIQRGIPFVAEKARAGIERVRREIQERPKWGIPAEEETKMIQEAQKEPFKILK